MTPPDGPGPNDPASAFAYLRTSGGIGIFEFDHATPGLADGVDTGIVVPAFSLIDRGGIGIIELGSPWDGDDVAAWELASDPDFDDVFDNSTLGGENPGQGEKLLVPSNASPGETRIVYEDVPLYLRVTVGAGNTTGRGAVIMRWTPLGIS